MAKLITIEQPLERESAVALGFFDGVHLGHRAVLRAAATVRRKRNDAVRRITFCRRFRAGETGQNALLSLYRSAENAELEACGIERVYCPPFSQLCALDGAAFCRDVLAGLFHAREVFCGGDFHFGAKAAWDVESLRQFGAEMGFAVHQVAPVLADGEKISSSTIRQALLDGKPEQAAALLGAPYAVLGNVVHGARWAEPTPFPPSTSLLRQDSWFRGTESMCPVPIRPRGVLTR